MSVFVVCWVFSGRWIVSWRVIQDSTESAKESEQSKTEFDLCEAVKVFSIDEAKRQCKCEEANAKRQCVGDLVGK